MEVYETKSKKPKQKKYGNIQISYSDPAYAQHLSFYQIPPTEEVTMEEFEDYGFSRLKVLKEIEACKIRAMTGRELDDKIAQAIRDNLQLNSAEGYRKDVVSHFTLRLAFCRPNDRKWFVKHEAQLLRYRLKFKPDSIQSFLKENNLKYQELSYDEFVSCKDELRDVHNFRKENPKFYKVPFEEALDLVKNRRVMVRRGNAYVAEEDLSSILIVRFKNFLRGALEATFKSWTHKMVEFESIRPIIDSLSKQLVGSDYKVDTKAVHGTVELNQIDMLSKRSFPMCMKHTHQKLKETHHLKHMARMQFGLFLKGIGLNLQDALTFWRSEFTQIMGGDKFEKSYSYNIRHNYGKEGRRADYTPYSCIKIIMSHVGPSDNHGCPFKTYDPDVMKASLKAQGVSNIGISEVIELVKGEHFQIACRRHFELTHPGEGNPELVINHPNQYFDESEKYYGSNIKPQQTDKGAQFFGKAAAPVQQQQELTDEDLMNLEMPETK